MNENQVVVIKLNPEHEETWRYMGRIIVQEAQTMLIEARFNRSTVLFHGITLQENDRFLERYYADRWYNLFEIHDRENDALKGWYCNVTAPAEFSDGKIAYIDLALDVLVYPNGKYIILDEDEYDALTLTREQQRQTRRALKSLVNLAETGRLAAAVHDGE